jgi:ATP-dependent RNA helicase DDX24/MAK5
MEYLLKKLNFKEERPKFIDANPVSQMTSNLREGIVECAGLEKDLYLYSLLMHYPNTRTLIFANSIASVRRLTPLLQNLNVPAHALHSQMIQKARLRSLERFSSPSHPGFVLVATDVAARGLDIPSVQLVVHYHLPRAADMYVHRSGRTARGTNTGSSILLCAPEEVQGVRRLVAKVHARNAVAQKTTKFYMQTIDIDRRVVARLKSRVTLAKKISDASLAKEKGSHEENWLRTAAADLGVDYDSEEFIAQDVGKKGRGQGRKKVEREARAMTKGEVGALKAELKRLLAQRVNVGVSERYLSAGGVDVDELLQESRRGEFLGKVRGLGLD